MSEVDVFHCFETLNRGMKYDVDLCFREPLEYRARIRI